MSKILMVTWDGSGNFPPERELVRGLLARGHSVHVLAHDTLRSQVQGDGAEFLPLHGVFLPSVSKRGTKVFKPG